MSGGAFAMAVPAFTGEMVEPRIRGALACLMQVGVECQYIGTGPYFFIFGSILNICPFSADGVPGHSFCLRSRSLSRLEGKTVNILKFSCLYTFFKFYIPSP